MPATVAPTAADAAIRIDLGIFARDEADSIGALIADLGRQDIMAEPAIDLRVLVLANGCRDETVAQARTAAAALPSGGSADVSEKRTVSKLSAPPVVRARWAWPMGGSPGSSSRAMICAVVSDAARTIGVATPAVPCPCARTG